MKCDKHGIEMEWRGSLMKGGMHCDHCELDKAGEMYGGSQFDKAMLDAAVTGTGVMGIDPGDLQGSFNAPRVPVPSPLTPHGLVNPRAATSVAQARGRIDDAQYAQTALSHGGGLAHCPYCEKIVGVAHFGPHDPQGDLCFKAYNRDHDVVARGHV